MARVGSRGVEDRAQDILDLIGTRSHWAWLVTVAYVVAMFAVVATTTGQPTRPWPPVVAAVLLSLAAVAVIWVPGDPLPLMVTCGLAVACPLACFLVLMVTPEAAAGSILAGWAHGGPVAVYCFMTVRGRYVAAWASLLVTSVVVVRWGVSVGLSLPVSISLLHRRSTAGDGSVLRVRRPA